MKETSKIANKESIVADEKTTEHNNHILALKANNEKGKEQFELQVKQLQERLQEPDASESDKAENQDKN